ncbi:hypothetical protein [Hydrogenimonas sp.]
MALYYIGENGTVVREKSEDVVVVAPSLYWYGHAKFPTSSIAKAKRLADSYLASRPASYTSIHVEKSRGGFDCYAYDEAHLRSLVAQHTSPKTPCYFLQQFSAQMPLRIDENLIAETINGICIEMENGGKTLPSLDSLDFRSLAKPFNAAGETGIPKGVAAGLVFLLLATATGDLALRYQTLQALQSRAAEGTQKSMYEIKALVKTYAKIDTEQRRLRATIQKALSSRMKRLECSVKKGCVYE